MRTSRALDLAVLATPATNPEASRTLLYVKSDGVLYQKNSAGVESVIGPSSALATAITNTSVNTVYPDNTAYWRRVLTTDGFSVNGMLTGSRVGTAHTQRLQDEVTGNTYARVWLNATTVWSGWLLYLDAGDFLAKGDLLAGSGASAFARLPAGADTQVLTLDSTQATGMKWAAAAAPPSPSASDHGYLAWSGDPEFFSSAVIHTTGVATFTKVYNRGAAVTISGCDTFVGTAGATLTNVGFAIYTAAGVLSASSVNVNGATAAAFQTTGTKRVTWTPVAMTGPFYLLCWFSGTTMPALLRLTTALTTIPNMNLAAPNFRSGTTGSALTTTAPSPMGTQTSTNTVLWAGVV